MCIKLKLYLSLNILSLYKYGSHAIITSIEEGVIIMVHFEKYLKKHNLTINEILYIYRHDRKTILHLQSGDELSTSIPIHEAVEFLPVDQFLSITKGVLIRLNQIIHISDEGLYTMTDGRTFQGRQRSLSSHKKLREELMLNASPKYLNNFRMPLSFLEKCSILDDMPIAYCVIELVFDEAGKGMDFIFRYCNKHMEVVEGIPLNDMLNRSFYEVFKNGDKKWLIFYADVALNGTTHTFQEFSPEISKHLTIHCYQPEPGFCACILLPEDAA